MKEKKSKKREKRVAEREERERERGRNYRKRESRARGGERKVNDIVYHYRDMLRYSMSRYVVSVYSI